MIDNKTICKCGHNFAAHQLLPWKENFKPCSVRAEINKTTTRCRLSAHSIPLCDCQEFEPPTESQK